MTTVTEINVECQLAEFNSFFVVVSAQWYDLDAPEQAPFPMKYEEGLSAFQKLLLLRCSRVDRVFRAVTDYVNVTMGKK